MCLLESAWRPQSAAAKQESSISTPKACLTAAGLSYNGEKTTMMWMQRWSTNFSEPAECALHRPPV